MDQPTESTIFNFSVTPNMGTNLKEAARWCRFLAIIAFVFLGLMLLGSVVAGPVLISTFNSMMPTPFPMMAGALIAIVVVIVLFGIFLYALLYRFSTFTRAAIETNDERLFIKGLRSLKIYFIIYGVIGILGVLANISNLFK